ncbi:universal stress protein [Actinomycetes bacterium KLBMP 9797]
MRHLPEPRVVVGVGSSDRSSAAVSIAAREAALRGCPLLLIGAVAGSLPAISGRVRESWPGIPLMGLTTQVDISEALVVESRAASLVVVDRPDTGGRNRCEQVAAHAFCPTMIVPNIHPPAPDAKVLVGLAITPYDEPAIEYAFEEAALRGVPLVPIHVWWGVPDAAISEVDDFSYDLTTAHETADRLLAEALAGWAAKYPTVVVQRTPLYDVNPAQTLLEASAHAGLLVVGANQHGPQTPHLLGTVARTILAKARCPVVVIRRATQHDQGVPHVARTT